MARIESAKTKVIEFATITGKSEIRIPYTSQKNTPIVKQMYIPKDKPFVFLDWMVLMACGKKEMVVKIAANVPIIFSKSM